jgi:integrase/recombinase XerC
MHPEQFIEYLRNNRRYSTHTLVAYQNDLSAFTDYCHQQYELADIHSADYMLIRSWIVSLMENDYDARSVNRKISTLRSFFNYLLREGVIVVNPMLKIKAPKTAKKLPVFVNNDPVEALLNLDAFDDDFLGWQKRMILEMFYRTGMRLSELMGLKLSSVDIGRSQLKVLGKRNKERIIPVSPAFNLLLQQYLQKREEAMKENDEGYLFCLPNGKKLYPKKIYLLVNEALSQVTTLSKKSPHVLRHTFATQMLNNGADINAIKEILGHANLSATQVYTHNSIEKLKNLHKQAHPRS